MRILELGSYVSIAYAGMVLAEQGHEVFKWVSPGRPDPIEGLKRGDELWRYINHGKTVIRWHARNVDAVLDGGAADAVIDNIRAETWESWGIDPKDLASTYGIPWVSLRDDFGGRSFDAIAQARAWGDHVGYVPVYIGDTSAGLWTAFKLVNAPPGHHVLHQAACLAKLVEGELVVPQDRGGLTAPPWDEPGTYGRDGDLDQTRVIFRNQVVREPFRNDAWRRHNLRHVGGRYVI
jgi:hypothetical protein